MAIYQMIRQLNGGGGSAVINPLSVSANGTYSVPEGVDGYNPVEVAVPMPSGTYSIGANGDYDIASYASVAVSVPTGVFPSGTSNITSNGTYDVTNYASASVNVSGGEDNRLVDLLNGSLHTIEVSNVGTLKAYAFYGDYELSEVKLPDTYNVYENAFRSCSLLTSVSMPKLSYVGSGAFSHCTALSTLSFPYLKTINLSAFRECYQLLSLYLMSDSIVTLKGLNAFTSTPISTYTTSTGGVYGSIFVPSSLYSQYIAASNWSNFASRFVSV